MTVRQLLAYTAGLPLRARLQAFHGTRPADIRAGVMRENLSRSPGKAVEYTDRAGFILGHLIDDLAGVPSTWWRA